MTAPVEKCPRCEHPTRFHDKVRGCRCAFTERDPRKGKLVVVCGCRWQAAAPPVLVKTVGGAA